ncbi:MAG: hypothetical protein QXR84_00395 [Candidatus Bathyarchaeia archaeon]|nr:hypothetical protein [Candidatus Bathyarchaeota archaeon]
MSIKELNEKLNIISRVVIHPKYRSTGLGQKIVKETLQLCGTPYVEMIAVMAKYNPFAEKAGMRKIAETKPPGEIIKIIEELRKLGFNTLLLAYEKYVLEKLGVLNMRGMEYIKEVFSAYRHPRLAKALGIHSPYIEKQIYVERLKEADAKGLAKLIKTCGILAQTKVYLFYQHLGAQ